MLDLSSLHLGEIANALADQTDYERQWLIDPQTGEQVAWCLPVDAGVGCPRRFKDQLHQEYPELLPAWYAFRDARAERRAVQWLADNSLIDNEAADMFLTGHPDPGLP